MLAGIYFVTATDLNGCSSPATKVIVTQPGLKNMNCRGCSFNVLFLGPLQIIDTLVHPICAGEELIPFNLNATGGDSSYDFTLDNLDNGNSAYFGEGQIFLTAGTSYEISVTDRNGCRAFFYPNTTSQGKNKLFCFVFRLCLLLLLHFLLSSLVNHFLLFAALLV